MAFRWKDIRFRIDLNCYFYRRENQNQWAFAICDWVMISNQWVPETTSKPICTKQSRKL